MEDVVTKAISVTEHLSKLPFFKSLNEAQLREVARLPTLRNVEPSEVILFQSDASNDVYFIVRGRVRTALFTPKGREMSYQDLNSGEMFGELSAIDDQPRSTQVTAMEEGLMLVFKRQDFRFLLQHYPTLSWALQLRLVSLVRFFCKKSYAYGGLDVKTRIRMEMRDLIDVDEQGQAFIQNLPTHQALANRLATQREAVTREISHLEKAQAIHKQGNKILILKPEYFEAI